METIQIIWIALFIVFVIIELATVNLVSIWFAIGAMVALLTSLIGFDIGIQLLMFVIGSVAGLIITKPVVNKIQRSKTYPTNTDAIIGKTGVVLQSVSKNTRGLVKVEGLEWTAITYEDKTYEIGELVVIEAVIGVKVLIK